MGLPRASKMPRPPSRSRFQEGSMNDRTSNTPPVHFIGPEERAALEKPLPALPFSMMNAAATEREKKRPVSMDPVPPPFVQSSAAPTPAPTPAVTKRGSKQFLGQMWDGVMGKLRIKRDTVPAEEETKRRKSEEKKGPAKEEERPSRDDILESYNHLVASGFFAAHAIQSTRQPGPPMSRPSTADQASYRPSMHQRQQQHQQQHTPRQQWPLSPLAATPPRIVSSGPVPSPASVSSRGTKRAAEDDDENIPLQQLQNIKKLRKSASATKDTLAVPKLRSSSRTMLSRRSVSNARAAAAAQAENSKSARRGVFSRLPGLQQQSLQVPDRDSSSRRNASESYRKFAPPPQQSTRVLRPRRSANEPLRMRPDANRGIPTVPNIPNKFTFGQDRENDGPWRGLRRAYARED